MRGRLSMRGPRAEDAARIWTELPAVGTLERNTPYAYLLLCTHFAETGLVSEQGGALAGFVLAYRPPIDPEALFVWQVGVTPAARGAGLGGRMLDALLDRPACRDVRWLMATVSPDNDASRALFRGFARRREAICGHTRAFDASLFPRPHPPEDLLRIGPLPRGGPSPRPGATMTDQEPT